MLTYKGTVQIESERLVLRRFRVSDVREAYTVWLSDQRVSLFMRWQAHKDIEETRDLIEAWISQYSNPAFYQWAITLKETGGLIGAIGLVTINEYDECADVGYCLGQRYWGGGYMTEALSAVLCFAFSQVGFNRLEAYHSVDNPGSGRVMEKAGMHYEGLARQKYRSNRGFEDVRMYAVLKDDYLG